MVNLERSQAYNKRLKANISQTATSILNLTISLDSQWKVDSNRILSVRKYCQFFTYESNTFLCKKYVILPIQTNGCSNAEKSRKSLFPLGYVDPRLIHPYLHRPHSPSQTASGSSQPFCHNTLPGQTDRHRHTHGPADGLGDRSVR